VSLLKQNLPKLYTFGFFSMFLVHLPVLVPYFDTRGVGMQEFFQLIAVFSLAVVVGEVPSGYLSDVWGRKKTLVLGSLLVALSSTVFPFLDHYWEFIVYYAVSGLGYAVISGTDVAMLYDSRLATGGDLQGANIFGNMQFAKTLSEAISAVIGGALVALSFEHVLYANAVIGWIPLLVALTLTEPPFQKMAQTKHLDNFKTIARHLARGERLTRLLFLNIVVWGLATYLMVWIYQRYWQAQAVELTYFGLLWAAHNLLVSIVSKLAMKIEARLGRRMTLLVIGTLPLVGYFGMAWLGGWPGIMLGFTFQICRGITQAVLPHELNARVPSSFRATVNSLASLAMRLAACLAGPFIGFLIDAYGFAVALSVGGSAFLIAFVVLLIPLLCLDPKPPAGSRTE
jgi:MFS family permease